MYLLESRDWLRRFETYALDSWFRLRPPAHSKSVVLVSIDDRDYAELFNSRSPLAPEVLAQLIAAIAGGRPKAIGIDLDTSDASYRSLVLPGDVPPIIWARDALVDQGIAQPLPVLGGRETAVLSGVALMPIDGDGLVRWYERRFRTASDMRRTRVDSFAWLVAKLSDPAVQRREDDHNELRLSFYSNPRRFDKISAANVLQAADGEGWASRGPLRDKVVLLGGMYRAARDQYATPIGPMSGVELNAQVVESELVGGGIRPPSETVVFLSYFLGSVLLVLINHRLGLRAGVLVSLAALPVLALVASLLSFSSLAMWFRFLPVLIGLLVHQVYSRAKEYLNDTLARHSVLEERGKSGSS